MFYEAFYDENVAMNSIGATEKSLIEATVGRIM